MKKKSISRSEKTTNGHKVVSNNKYDGLRSELTRLDRDLSLFLCSEGVRIFYSGKASDEQSNWRFTSENLVYFETELVSRPLEEPEVSWCEDTFMYSGDSRPDEVYEFRIPKPGKLKSYFLSDKVEMSENLDAGITNAEEREQLCQSLQEKIARSNYKQNQLDIFGNPHDLDAEWNPKYSDKGRDQLKDMSRMRGDAYMDVWRDTFELSYYRMKESRYISLDIREPWLSGTLSPSHKIVELGVLGKDSKNYCRLCGSVWDDSQFIHPKMKGYDTKTVRVCEDCSNRYVGDRFTQNSVAKALDKRAVNNNSGQRRLHEDFLDYS